MWQLLVKISNTQKYDKLVTNAIRFITAVAKGVHHTVFQDPATLKSVIEGVIMRNIQFTDADEEQFEDNPVEYIRRDAEVTYLSLL